MKRLVAKDKKLRSSLKKTEKQRFVLKSILKNTSILSLTRWNAFLKFKEISSKNSEISVVPRCVFTVNKKRFNKQTLFSRYVFLKMIRSGQVTGMKKAVW